MFRKRIKQVIAMSLCVAMCLTAVPVSAEEKADTQTSGITADQTEIQQDSTTDGQETNQNISGETVQSETEVEDTVQVEKEDPQVSGDSQTVGMEDDQTADVGTLQSQEQTEESSAETQNQAEEQKEITVPHIIYQSQVQLDGWQSEVQDGATSGTVGEFKRMESVRVRLEDQPYEGNVEYRAHEGIHVLLRKKEEKPIRLSPLFFFISSFKVFSSSSTHLHRNHPYISYYLEMFHKSEIPYLHINEPPSCYLSLPQAPSAHILFP